VSPLRGVDDPERLRALVAAVMAIGSDLSLPAVLRHIVESAVALVGAGYGALGVLDTSGSGLAEFVNVGMSPEQVAAIGHLPEGHGILGLLILEPKPLRLADLGVHPDSYGFPDRHPPMRSFLGVPIRVRGQVFGNLYLTDKQGAAEFSEEDEILAVALAGQRESPSRTRVCSTESGNSPSSRIGSGSRQISTTPSFNVCSLRVSGCKA
jgi:GAF domain-containing protein